MTQATPVLNPLSEGLSEERAAEPCAMIILGAHGDLTKRKLIPSLYALHTEGLLPRGFAVVGMSRTELSHKDFREKMREAVRSFAPELSLDNQSWDSFAGMLYYLPGNFGKSHGFDELKNLLADLADSHGTGGNSIFYMSTPPSLYPEIASRIDESGLSNKGRADGDKWTRIIVEKPFGHDLVSARALNDKLHEVFAERQIYRIDHYLGKETVQNIMVFRFANGIFEPLWNHRYIDHIQITNAESIGVESRGPYYEESGNLRDMIQNHMLSLVSLVAMEPPVSLSDDDVRDEKAKVLRSIRPFDAGPIDDVAVRGQYGPGWILGEKVAGYRQEDRVSPQSRTETFTALKLYMDNWRWADVPFYVRSGKRLGKRVTEIAVHFKKAPHRLFLQSCHEDGDLVSPNVLVMKIQPDEGISLKFATKLPGPTTKLRWLSMDFRYGSAFGVRSPSAYERLILDCLIGDASLYARTDFVDESWSLIDPVLDYWANSSPPDFPNYDAGSWGPKASDRLIASTGHEWRRL